MILSEDEVQKILKDNTAPPHWITKARDESDKLFALMHGDNFLDLLIEKIEYIESVNKARARAKYSRNIVHFFTRLLRPVANVYSANGGSISFHLKNDERDLLVRKMSRTKNGKSLREWLKTFWMPLYHSDPNGIIFIEYEVEPELNCWPTYKQISHIQAYLPKGQLIEWLMFAPRKVKIGKKEEQVIRFVDDTMDRTYLIKQGGQFLLLDEINGKKVTFEHPFGQVPALINSDIESFRTTTRLTPVDAIVPVSEEYARDQSIKTIYKIRMGLPTEWKLSDQCLDCHGSGKNTEDGECKSCDGHGYYTSKDITDVKHIAAPEGEESVIKGGDTGGFIVPPAEVLKEFREELSDLDEQVHATHWGTLAGFTSVVQKTATQVFYDAQPMTDKLNDYGDVAEMMEGQIVEWFANLLFSSKPKDEKVASISYGRRYIIDPPDIILEKYERAKEKGDNNVILDRLYNEYLTSRFRRDPQFLRIMLLKSSVQLYLHLNDEQTLLYFGAIEVQKKILFRDWWETLSMDDKDKSMEVLIKEFDTWFVDQKKTVPTTGDGDNE